MSKVKAGLQLYTVRDELKKDFKGTVTKVAELGYDGVELAGMYGGMSPEELAVFLKGLNLEVCGLHASADVIANPEAEEYAYAAALDCTYLIPSLPADAMHDIETIIPKLERAARIAQDKGRTVAFHNHAHELGAYGDTTYLDTIYARIDPSLLKAELDLYWVQKGGQDPVAYVKKYAERLPLVHMKDMAEDSGNFAPVGTGTVDMQGVLAAAADGVTGWAVVEQDACEGPALESAAVSIGNLKMMLGR